MPRSFEVSVPTDQADALLRRVQSMEGVVGLVRHRGASIQPPGDIVVVQTTNDATRPVMDALRELDVLKAGSIATSEPRSMVSPGHQRLLDKESNETVWDEMVFLLREDTNIAFNYLALMALAGAVAAVGLWTNTLHLVIGAMVIAPAFEPLLQIPFGLICGPQRLARSGIASVAAGYAMLLLASLVCVWMLQIIDASRGADLQQRSWVQYWSSVSSTGVFVSVLGAAAGAVVVSGLRSVLTTGVMIALALVPSMAVVGMAIGVGDLSLAARGLGRWAIDAVLVIVITGIVFAIKKRYLHRGRALSRVT